MARLARQQAVLEILQRLRGTEQLRELFWRELNYDRVDEALSRRQWTDRQREALAEDPILWATAGAHNAFHVIYSRFDDDKLLLTKERLVVNKLLPQHDFALFIFSNKSQDLWHFVNVKYDRDRAKPDDKKRHLLRRITIGPEEQLRTASERIAKLDVEAIASSTLLEPTPLDIQAVHDEAFDVEAVTKRFFEEFTGRFAALQADLVQQTGDEMWAHDYALRFLSRLMFLYFVQRKRWLGDEPDFLATFWRSYQKSDQPRDSFFDKWLKALFFEAFNNKFQLRAEYKYFPDEIRDALSRAPYLNGGLFSKDEKLDGREDFAISDAQFEGVFDFLEGYNFTIAEDTPLDQEIAVDPEMIGKVYESLVNIGTEEDLRGEAGIFYTPRLEIDLMCRLSLVDYLSNHVGEKHKSCLYEAVFALDEEEKENADEHLLKDGLWPQVSELVESVKVVDPACGSGSFLVGMMLLLADLRERARDQLGTEAGIALDRYRFKKQIIAESLYGVDVMEWAVHVAELRLWLQLVVDAELPFEQRKLQPLLPNLSFKVRQGDSLVQEVAGIDLSHIHGRTQLPQGMKGRLTKLLGEKRRYFRGGSEADEQRIRHEERLFFQDLLFNQKKDREDQAASKDRELRTLKNRLVDVEMSQKELPAAHQLEQEIEQFEQQAQEARETADSIASAEKVPFIWDMAFAEVFESERRGFDIVVGNPPYVRQEKIADPQQEGPTLEQRKEYKGKLMDSVAGMYPSFARRHGRLDARNDLYVYFYLHGLNLLNPQGSFCFVTSNSWLDVGYGRDLQEFLLRHSHVKMILDNQVKRTFSASDVNTIIALLAAPDDTSDGGLDKTARFVMFTRPFEDVFHPVIFEEIEDATEPLTKADYRLRVLNQQAMLEAGMQASEKKRGAIIEVGKYTGDKWGGKYLRAPDIYWKILEKAGDKLVRLGDIAEVRRGFTTGCNEFFYLPSKHFDIQPEGDYYRLIPKHEGLPEDLRIEAEFLRPALRTPRDSYYIDTRSGTRRFLFHCSANREHLDNTGARGYIQWGKEMAFNERSTCASRAHWWLLPQSIRADLMWPRAFFERFMCYEAPPGYLAGDSFFIVGGPARVPQGVAPYLNSLFCALFVELDAFQMNHGGISTNVYWLEGLPVLSETSDAIQAAYKSLRQRPIFLMNDEIKQADRQALGRAIAKELGLSGSDVDELYRAVRDMVHERIAKSRRRLTQAARREFPR